jgi:hypothetical protein
VSEDRLRTDPLAVLGVAPDADDSVIRRAYLRLVRDHSPERDPEGFRRVRAAYEAVRSQQDRVARRLLEAPQLPDVEAQIRTIGGTSIPTTSREIRGPLRAAVVRLLPHLQVSEDELGTPPEELPEEES